MAVQQKVLVVGHQNPDTDSICSAIAYARLKNAAEKTDRYEACAASGTNQETGYALKRFHAQAPRRLLNVKAEVRDIEIRQVPGVSGDTTVKHSWQTMRDMDAHSQPIVDENGRLEGMITSSDLAKANMEGLDNHILAKCHTPISNIVDTLDGTVLTGNTNATVEGKIVIGAGSPEAMEDAIEAGDIVIVANRYETQLCAIEMDAAVIIVCIGSKVAKTIIKLAEEHGCIMISTPYDSYTVAGLIKQSAPIRAFMTPADKLLSFELSTPVDEVKKVMGRVRYVYFPIRSKAGKYMGLVSRRNLLNLKRKQLILVDHNEKTQCVEGYEEAEILEIIDHHRIGNLETSGPVYFRNQPVGCTATIINQMYLENSLQPDADTAGLLLCAILSDTLMFRSPTCTPLDVSTAETLAKIAGVDIKELADEMFEAGENLEGRTAEEIFFADFKTFIGGEVRFGVGQGSYMSPKTLQCAKSILLPYIEEARKREGVGMIFYLLTNVPAEDSMVLYSGEGARELLENAFPGCGKNGDIILKGVVSRKKQLIPTLLSSLQQG